MTCLPNASAAAAPSGKEEGAFAWLTLNYLLGKLGGPLAQSVAAIDLGGGSVQEAFAMSETEAAAAPGEYVVRLKALGKPYAVYVHSYLNYGLMASRAQFLGGGAAAAAACFGHGANGSYAYAGKTYALPASTGADAAACGGLGSKLLKLGEPCKAEQALCSFNGAWRGKGPGPHRMYYVSSYFWDRARDAGIINVATAIQWPITPKAFGKAAGEACKLDASSVVSKYPTVKPEQAPYFCLDLVYCHTLLTQGFKLSDSAAIMLVKQVEYNGQRIEAAWPLGAAINDMAAAAA